MRTRDRILLLGIVVGVVALLAPATPHTPANSLLIQGVANAGVVNHSSTGDIVAFAPIVDYGGSYSFKGQTGWVLLRDGTTWLYYDGGGHPNFELLAEVSPLPVGIAEVYSWTPWAFVTQGGELWNYIPVPPGSTSRQWVNYGSPLNGPIPTSSESVGELKGRFRHD